MAAANATMLWRLPWPWFYYGAHCKWKVITKTASTAVLSQRPMQMWCCHWDYHKCSAIIKAAVTVVLSLRPPWMQGNHGEAIIERQPQCQEFYGRLPWPQHHYKKSAGKIIIKCHDAYICLVLIHMLGTVSYIWPSTMKIFNCICILCEGIHNKIY